MVKYLFFLLLLKSFLLFGQHNCESASDYLYQFRHHPIFDKSNPNSDYENIYRFIRENITYPETAIVDKIEGMVIITFWIDTLGYTSEHKVCKGIREDLDNEALRVFKLMKYDIPAKDNYGKPIGIRFGLPIHFSLENVNKSKKLKLQTTLKKQYKVNSRIKDNKK